MNVFKVEFIDGGMRVAIPHIEKIYDRLALIDDDSNDGYGDVRTAYRDEPRAGFKAMSQDSRFAPPVLFGDSMVLASEGYYISMINFFVENVGVLRNFSEDFSRKFREDFGKNSDLNWKPLNEDGCGNVYRGESTIPDFVIGPLPSVGTFGDGGVGRVIAAGDYGARSHPIDGFESFRLTIDELVGIANCYFGTIYQRNPIWIEKYGLKDKIVPLQCYP